MNFEEYQKKIEEFVVYPRDQWAGYLSVKLMGECGELANIVGKEIRNGDFYPAMIEDEAGDILWYLARICSEVEINFQTAYTVSKLTKKHIGSFRGKLREIIRKSADLDNLLEIGGNYYEIIYVYVPDIFHWLLEIMSEYDLDCDEVMRLNIEKLNNRKQNHELKHI